MTDSKSIRSRTKAVPGEPDGKNDLRVILDWEGKNIIHDYRPKGEKKD